MPNLESAMDLIFLWIYIYIPRSSKVKEFLVDPK
jgi:hypothetical protein